MHLELNDIKDGCLHRELILESTEFPIVVAMERHDEISFVEPVRFLLRMQKSGQLIEVDGQLSTRVELLCGRCLQPYEKALQGDFAFTFTPYVVEEKVADEGEVEVELDTDELGLVFYEDDTLDLLPPLQDQLVMLLPISSICSKNCQGLCSECGCNLNIEKCQCEKKVFNNRFSALAGLKIEPSDK